VTNPTWNGKRVIRRKDAEHYVSSGHAVWLFHDGRESDQIRLLESNNQNRANAAEAATGYRRAAAVMIQRPEELRHIPVLLPHIALMKRSAGGARHSVSGRSGPVKHILKEV
jgi:hypothetical protein